jgi:hypothetical protein
VTSLAFNQDGSRLASADLEGRIILWDPKTGTALRRWNFPGALRVLGFSARRELVVVDECGTVSILPCLPTEPPTPGKAAESANATSKPAPDQPPRVRRGRLEMETVVSKKDWNDFMRFLFLAQDTDGSILAASMDGAVYRIRDRHDFDIVAVGYGTPFARTIFAFRDTRTNRILVKDSTRRSIYAISDDGRVDLILRDDAVAGMSNFVPIPDGSGWFVTNRDQERLMRLTRRGRIETIVESPFLDGVRGIVVDRFSGDLIVGTTLRQLYRIGRDGTIAPLVPPNLRNSLCQVHQMAQDPRTGDLYCVGYGYDSLCRVSPQGVVRVCANLRGDYIGLVRDRRNGDFFTAHIGQCRMLRLSGFETASQAEIDNFLPNCSESDLFPK